MTHAIQPNRPRVLSGMRPTGRLHLGNYMGALKNWVDLQNAVDENGNPKYDCYFFIADYHALTTDYEDPTYLLSNIFQITVDFLSAGLDPEKSTIFVQSHVPQHAELNLIFSMFTPLGWLERVPTYKDQQEQLREKDLATYGFLGYPLLQSADILLYQPDFVPVGQDQVAHVELTREVARRFNSLYSPKRLRLDEEGSGVEETDPDRLILPEPEVLLTPSPKLPGLDGRKMSKSYGNSILISEHTGNILEKMSRMTNGGQRNPQSEPGDPDACPVGDMHRLFSDDRTQQFIRSGCIDATIRCSECKTLAANGIILHLHPMRERRERLERNPAQVWDILGEGASRAQERAVITMDQVRDVTGLSRVRRPVPVQRRVRDRNLEYDAPHDLSEQSLWWDLTQEIRARRLREHWLYAILPSEIRLATESARVFTTRKQKRVYVTTSREAPSDSWHFIVNIKEVKSYELMVLLCWSKNFQLHDFVVPQAAYVQPWTALKKQSKQKEKVEFWVVKRDERFNLELPDSPPIDITEYRGKYKPLD